MPNVRFALALGALSLTILLGCNELPPEDGEIDSETLGGSGAGAEAIESALTPGKAPTACASLHQCYIACNRAGGDVPTLDACKNSCTARTSPLGRQADAYLQGCMKAEGCLNAQGAVDGTCIDRKCGFERDFCLNTPPHYQTALGRASCFGVYRDVAAGVCSFAEDKRACELRYQNIGNYHFQKLLPRINTCVAQNGCTGGLFGVDNCGKSRCNKEWVECLDANPGVTPVQTRPAAGTPTPPTNPWGVTIKCQAQGTYNVCANGSCSNRGPVIATGAGPNNAEAQLNALKACNTNVNIMVTANSIGDHTSASSNLDCKVTGCS